MSDKVWLGTTFRSTQSSQEIGATHRLLPAG